MREFKRLVYILLMLGVISMRPSEFLGQATPHQVNLTWTASTSAVAGYNVYRSTVSGGPYTKLTSSLVSGVSYSDTAVLAGTTYFYVATAVSGSSVESLYSNEASATVPQTPSPLSITTSTLPNGVVGSSYSGTVQATGGTTPYTFAGSGAIPPGLTFASTGVLSGTPTTAGTFSFTVQVTDSESPPVTASANFSVVVNSVPVAQPITFVSPSCGASDTGSTLHASFSVPCNTNAGEFLYLDVAANGNPSLVASMAPGWVGPIGEIKNVCSEYHSAFYYPNAPSQTQAIVNFSPADNRIGLVLHRYLGIDPSSPLDGNPVTNFNCSAGLTSTSALLSTLNPTDLLIFGSKTDRNVSGFTSGPGYTLGGASTPRNAVEFEVVSQVQSGVSASMNMASAAAWVNTFLAFKAAPGGPPPAPPTVASVTVAQPSIVGGTQTSGTVTLSGPALSGGASVSLVSDNASVTVPSAAVVPQGSTSVTFTITAGAVSTSTSATITASYNGTSKSASITVTPPPDFTIAVAPTTATVVAGSTASYTVTITPVNGFIGTVSLTCLPTVPSCSVSPSSVNLDGVHSATVSMTLVPPNSYQLSVTGVSGSKSHSGSASLAVN